jgi:hypothetical protein
MKTIPLTQGYEAIVDDEDFEALSQVKWNVSIRRTSRTFYAARGNRLGHRPANLLMHRVIMAATLSPGAEVDHINGNGLDNRRENLRVATRQQNAANIRRVKGRSGFKGVELREHARWRASICGPNGTTHIGYFSTPQEAAHAYDAEAVRLFGEFASTNKMLGLI